MFDCPLLKQHQQVKYVHNGSPLLEEDTIMLRVYRSVREKLPPPDLLEPRPLLLLLGFREMGGVSAQNAIQGVLYVHIHMV